MAVALAFFCDGHVHRMIENGGFVSLRLAAFCVAFFLIHPCLGCRFQLFLYQPVQAANLEEAQLAAKLTHDFGVFGGMRRIERRKVFDDMRRVTQVLEQSASRIYWGQTCLRCGDDVVLKSPFFKFKI